jgi:hypothetical protein
MHWEDNMFSYLGEFVSRKSAFLQCSRLVVIGKWFRIMDSIHVQALVNDRIVMWILTWYWTERITPFYSWEMADYYCLGLHAHLFLIFQFYCWYCWLKAAINKNRILRLIQLFRKRLPSLVVRIQHKYNSTLLKGGSPHYLDFGLQPTVTQCKFWFVLQVHP